MINHKNLHSACSVQRYQKGYQYNCIVSKGPSTREYKSEWVILRTELTTTPLLHQQRSCKSK